MHSCGKACKVLLKSAIAYMGTKGEQNYTKKIHYHMAAGHESSAMPKHQYSVQVCLPEKYYNYTLWAWYVYAEQTIKTGVGLQTQRNLFIAQYTINPTSSNPNSHCYASILIFLQLFSVLVFYFYKEPPHKQFVSHLWNQIGLEYTHYCYDFGYFIPWLSHYCTALLQSSIVV